MGAGPEAAVATMPDSEETVVLVTALDEDSDDEMSTDNGIKLIDRRKYMLYTALLAAVAVLAVCISAVALSSSALSPLHVRHTERLIQVYTPAQATRAAKHAVAQLQLIEQRRPFAMSAANPFALPSVRETDVNTE